MGNNIRDKDLFDAVVRLLDREDNLINSRMTWYLTIQGFIVAAAALIFTGRFKHHQYLPTPAIRLLSSIGIAISLVLFISVRRARITKREVGDQWNSSSNTVSFPDPRGETSWLSFLTPGQSVPWIFIVFWIIVIIYA